MIPAPIFGQGIGILHCGVGTPILALRRGFRSDSRPHAGRDFILFRRSAATLTAVKQLPEKRDALRAATHRARSGHIARWNL